MKTLLLLRHAKSSWAQACLSDHDRPLNQRGLRDAPRMGQLLRDRDLMPDLILCSSARRAQETAERVLESSGYGGELQIRQDLYHASPATCIKVLGDLSDENECVLLIGHNPGFEEVLDRLAGRYERMPTAALAHLALEIATWRDLKQGVDAELVDFWRPRELS